jgi:hypothetical protein
MKDLVKRPQQKYDTLFRELQKQDMQLPDANSGSGNPNTSTEPANDAMKNELKRYLMELSAPEPVPQQQSSITNSNFIEFGSAYQ